MSRNLKKASKVIAQEKVISGKSCLIHTSERKISLKPSRDLSKLSPRFVAVDKNKIVYEKR